MSEERDLMPVAQDAEPALADELPADELGEVSGGHHAQILGTDGTATLT